MHRLMSGFGLDQDDLFHTHEELLDEALARQEQRIAYVDKDLVTRRGTARMKIYTIGFTKKPASTFFGLLRKSGAERLVDVRLNNVSQLAGFAKRDDLVVLPRRDLRNGLPPRAPARTDQGHAR